MSEHSWRKKIFLARANLTWYGTLNVLWQLSMCFVAMASIADIGAVVNHPYLISVLMFTSMLVSGLSLAFNMLYWGPTAGTRKNMKDLEPCRRHVGESDISFELHTSRVIRCYMDQWIEAWILATSTFVLIWMIRFYWYNGVNQFQPLPPAFTSVQFSQYIQSLLFSVSMLFIGATTVLATLCPLADMVKRFIINIYVPHVEKAGSMESRLQTAASSSTLLGAVDL